MDVDIWSDVVCPWCYAGAIRFERALETHPHRDAVRVRLHAFELHPELPVTWDGTRLVDYWSGQHVADRDIARGFEEYRTVTREAGVHIDLDTVKVVSSRRAHRVLQAAIRADDSAHPDGLGSDGWSAQRAVKQALFQAHFTSGEDIGQPDVLVRAGAAGGLSEEAVHAALDDHELDLAVTDDIRRARRMGITGVPYLLLADAYALPGAQTEAGYTAALDAGWRLTHPDAAITPLTNLVPGADGQGACGPDGCS